MDKELIREVLYLPSYKELYAGIIEHYHTIRTYAKTTDTRLYSCGWLLDIARCIYTLRNNDIISKTRAGTWALKQDLCPDKGQMVRTLHIRSNPMHYKDEPEVKLWLTTLGPCIQRFADVLENEISKYREEFT